MSRSISFAVFYSSARNTSQRFAIIIRVKGEPRHHKTGNVLGSCPGQQSRSGVRWWGIELILGSDFGPRLRTQGYERQLTADSGTGEALTCGGIFGSLMG